MFKLLVLIIRNSDSKRQGLLCAISGTHCSREIPQRHAGIPVRRRVFVVGSAAIGRCTQIEPCCVEGFIFCVLFSLPFPLVDGLDAPQNDLRPLVAAIAMLESAISRSSNFFQFKLLLLRLYARLGAVGATIDMYRGCDIKNIQRESLGFLIVHELQGYCSLSNLEILYEKLAVRLTVFSLSFLLTLIVSC